MAESFVNFEIETDPEELVDLFVEYMQVAFPGWEPQPGNVEFILAQAWARIAAEVRDVAANVPPEIFRYFGRHLANLPPREATRATADSTWTMIDNSGYTIPAGTLVIVPATGDEDVIFETLVEYIVPPGATVATPVPLVALEPGTHANGLDGPATSGDPLAFVDSITLDAPSIAGLDAETTSEYEVRLKEQLTLQAPRPILPADFEAMARSVPGVWRALALDGFNPADSTTGNERMIALAVVDESGLVPATSVKTAVDALLQSQREVNFVVNVIDPVYTEIKVTFTATAYPGYDPAEVEARAIAAVQAYLSPAEWGVVALDTRGRSWLNTPTVRYLEVAQAINDVEGVDYITALTIAEESGVLGTVNVDLSGAVPMPTAGTIDGTINAP